MEFSHDLLRNDETQANTIFVQLLGVFDEAKKLEKLALLLLWDAYSRVLDRNSYVLVPFLFFNLYKYFDASTSSELKGVRLKPQ